MGEIEIAIRVYLSLAVGFFVGSLVIDEPTTPAKDILRATLNGLAWPIHLYNIARGPMP